MRGILSLGFAIVVGTAIADLAIHPSGTNAIFNGLNKLWTTSVHGLLGSTS